MQLGKMLGALYGGLGLIFVPFFGIFGIISASISKQIPSLQNMGWPEILVILFLAVLVPVTYAIMGFIIGLIGAAIYNLLAKWIGGIEVEVE